MANSATAALNIGGAEVFGSLAGGGALGGNVSIGANNINVGQNNSSTVYAGTISGTGIVTKAGTGTWELSGTNTYAGNTLVNAGIFSVTGTLDAQASIVQIANGTFLTGTGSINRNITVLLGGGIDPGTTLGSTLGTLTAANNVTFQAGSAYYAQLGAVGTNDAIVRTGTGSIFIGGTTTNLIPSVTAAYVPNPGQVFTILDTSAGTGTITGTFAGLPEGAQISAGGTLFTINYTSTTVTLTDAGPAASVVYVNNNWSDTTPGNDPDGVGLGITASFGTTAFSTIAAAIAAVRSGGTIIIEGGTYAPDNYITKPLTFQFITDTVTTPNQSGENLVTLSGALNMLAPLTLSDHPTLTPANLTFGGTINGAQPLDLSPLAITVTLGGVIGGVTPLTSFTTNGATFGNTVFATATTAITTRGNQTYNAPIVLRANTTLTTTTGGHVTFNKSINADLVTNNRGLTVNTNSLGDVQFNAPLGSTQALNGLTVTGNHVNATSTASITMKPTGSGAITIKNLGTTDTLAGAISGSNAFVKGNNAAGSAAEKASLLTLSGNNSFTGAVTIYQGGLRITQSTGFGTGTKTITATAGTNGNPNIHLDGSTGNITLPASMSFVTSNNNTNGTIINEAGANTINGNFVLSSGGGDTVINVFANSSITFNGNMAPNTTARILRLKGAGTGVLNGVLADGSNANTLQVRKEDALGVWTLNGANTYSNTTTVAAGTLKIGSGGPSGSIGFSRLVNNGTVIFDRTTALAHNGIISGTGNLVKNNTNTLTLTAVNTYTGTTTVNGGSLIANGALPSPTINVNTDATLGGSSSLPGVVTSIGGKLSPGNAAGVAGVLATGNLSLDSKSTYLWDFRDPFTTAALHYDQLNVTGSVHVDGTLQLTALAPVPDLLVPRPTPGTKFVIIRNDGADAVTGTFVDPNNDGFFDSAQGFRFSVSYTGGDGNDVELTYIKRIPGVTDDTFTTPEDTQLVVPASGVFLNDFIYAGVTAVLDTPTTNGKLVFNSDGSFTYTPNLSFGGTDTFTYHAIDALGTVSASSATVSISLSNGDDDTPVIISGGGGDLATYDIPENSVSIITVVATDADEPFGDFITYSIVSDPDSDGDLFNIDPVTGELAFKSGVPDYENPTDGTLGVDRDNIYTVFVRATDSTDPMPVTTDPLFDTQLVSISITNVNDPPTFTSPVITGGVTNVDVSENTVSPQKFIAIDQDNVAGDLRFNISKVAGASNVDAGLFSIDPISGILTFKQAGGADYDSPIDDGKDNVYNIDVEVSDGVGGTTTNSFTITIVPLNDNLPIYTTGQDLNVDENVQVVTTIVATDIDLKVSATTPTPLFDNQVVTYSIVTVVLGGAADSDLFSINPNTGVLQFITAGADYDIVADQDGNNIYEVTVRADDGFTGTTDRVFHVTLNRLNDLSPVIDNDSLDNVQTTPPVNPPLVIRYNEEQSIATIVTTAIATDGDRKPGSTPTTFVAADILEYTLTGDDANLFNIDKLSGALTFKAIPDFESPTDKDKNNSYELILNVNDGDSGHTQFRPFTVQVWPVNDNPIITSNGGLATASISLNESIGGESVLVTNAQATDAKLPPAVGNLQQYCRRTGLQSL